MKTVLFVIIRETNFLA